MERSFVLAALIVASAMISAVFLFGASASGIRLSNSDVGSAAPAMTFTVNNTGDNGAGSVRDAITQANATPGPDVINFDIGINTPTIIIGSGGFGPLPIITEAVTINGATGGATRVELDGTQAGAAANGLTIMAGNCIIQGLVINRFSSNGISIGGGGGNVVRGNFIGTDAAGATMLDNTESGVRIDGSPNNTIGGTSVAARNLISGNGGNGVQILNTGASNNTVQGNFIGADVTGTAGIRNASGGVLVLPGATALIGGSAAGTGNLISGNGGFGVRIEAGNNQIQGNLIGTTADGIGILPNGNGIELANNAVNNLIGGPGARNVISGNDASGVSITDNSSANQIQGNFIGTDISGTVGLGNLSGVTIDSGAFNNTLGGTAAGDGNVISANGNAGVSISLAAGNLVQGNLIGTDVSGVAALGNQGIGVRIGGSTLGNTIGGTLAGAPNTIAFNSFSGITIFGGTQNAVLSNSIFSNTGLGINLIDDPGVTPNDPCDGDTGANDVQNFPDLTSATSGGGNTMIQGSLNSTASTQFRIEFFSNTVCDGSGNGEGDIFIGSTVVTTDPACLAPFNVNLPVSVPAGQSITATATDLQGNTSEFSACVPVAAAPCTINCPANITRPNDPGACGAVITYPAPTIGGTCGTVTCNPPSGSFFPTGPTTVTCTTGAGPSCSFSVTVNDTGNPLVTCPPNQTAAATSPAGAPVAYPPPTASDNCPGAMAVCAPPSGSTFPVGVTTVTCTATDASTNQSTCDFTVTVTAQADLSITKNGSPNPVGSGANLTYDIAINNAGPSSATGVTVTDTVPAGTTFFSVTTSQGTSTAPPQGGTGTVTCSLGTIPFGGSANVTLVVKVNAAPGSTINNTASVTSTSNDPVPGNNSSIAMTPVIFSPCSINCPADVVANTLPLPFSCGARVSYPVPTTIGTCGGIICTPPSNSFFGLGVTLVTCTAEAGPSCSFNVTVTDTTAPRITCSGNISTSPAPGQNSVVVNYSSPIVVDNCSDRTATCTPPPGSPFGLGTSLVTCTTDDAAGNTSTCSFSVTVIDNQAPTITCPPPVAVDATPGQCAAIVNYPPPMVADDGPRTTMICAPPSGSTFPVGTTTVVCTATDTVGHSSTCTFPVTVNGGLPARIIIPGGKQSVEFGDQTPVPPVRKAKKNPPANCDCSRTFTIENTGCAVLGLNPPSISRTGSDVDSGRITNPDDTKFFSLRVIDPDGSERPVPELCAGFCIEIAPGQARTFRVVFSPVIPAPSGKTTGLDASSVLPNSVTSKITFTTNSGGPLTVNLIGHVGTALQLINARNPKKAASASFVRTGDEFVLIYSVFDANLDTTQARYEMLDQSGALVGQAIEVDLTQPIVDGQVFRGQSFVVEQRFSGARNHPEITGVRLTVFDAETNVSLTTQLGASANAASVRADSRALPRRVQPRLVRLIRKLP